VTGHQYTLLVGQYLVHNHSDRGLKVYREVAAGKSIIGKNRRVDLLLVDEAQGRAFAVECKFQDSQGTADEKIPYALDDLRALPMGGCVAYAGVGFSAGVLHMLQSSELAAYCLPDPEDLSPRKETQELDHCLAMHFKWWDILVRGKKPLALPGGPTGSP